MRIEAHILCWNESEILPLVIKHYQGFCDHITIWDNYSTDSSQLIAESMGCDVKKFGIKGQLDDDQYLMVKNHCWKGSEADWVIVCDADEILLPSIAMCDPAFIDCGVSITTEWENMGTIWKTSGWQIQSKEMPINNLLEITNGWSFANYSKSIIFSPKHIKEINYKPGCHVCEPVGDVRYSDKSLYLLHYKNMGGVERLLKRNREYMNRMSINNRRKGYGSHYWEDELKTRREFAERLAKSKPLI